MKIVMYESLRKWVSEHMFSIIQRHAIVKTKPFVKVNKEKISDASNSCWMREK